jgi:hypothetical protein
MKKTQNMSVWLWKIHLAKHNLHNLRWLVGKNGNNGQSEPTATNAPIGRFVHWMGCVYSFDVSWDSSQSISFHYQPLYIYILGFVLLFFS